MPAERKRRKISIALTPEEYGKRAEGLKGEERKREQTEAEAAAEESSQAQQLPPSELMKAQLSGAGAPNVIGNREDLPNEGSLASAEAAGSSAGDQVMYKPVTPRRTAEQQARLSTQAPQVPTRTKAKEQQPPK